MQRGRQNEWLSYSFPLVHSSNKAAADKINSHLQSKVLDNEKVLTDTGKVFEKSRYKNDSVHESGYSGISYEVEVNNSRLLSLQFQLESTGAYSENYQEYYNFNNQTGELIGAKTLFTPVGLEAIKKSLIKQRKDSIAKWMKEMDADPEDSDWIRETFEQCNQKADENSFLIRKRSIVFCKAYCFPHVARPYDTNLDIEFNYKQIEKFLSVEGKRLLLQKN